MIAGVWGVFLDLLEGGGMDLVIVEMTGAAEECRKTGGIEIGLGGWLADPGDVEEGGSAEDEV